MEKPESGPVGEDTPTSPSSIEFNEESPVDTSSDSENITADNFTGTDTGTTSGIPEVGPDSISWSDTNGIFIAAPTQRKIPLFGLTFWIAIALLAGLFLLYPFIDSMIDYGPYSKHLLGHLYLFFPLGVVLITFVATIFEKFGWLLPLIGVVLFALNILITSAYDFDQVWVFMVGYLILGGIAWLFGLIFRKKRTAQ